MYREKLTGKIRAWRDWEVLDEGVGGSLTTHLQEVLPCCKGEQSLTFKRYQRSTVARWEPKWELKIVLATCWQLIYYPDVWNNPKGLNLNTNDTILSLELFHFEGTSKLEYQNLKTQPILLPEKSSLLSKIIDFLLGKATVIPSRFAFWLFHSLRTRKLKVASGNRPNKCGVF